MQRLINRDILKRILLERKGRFVPIQSHEGYLTDEDCREMQVGNLEVHRILPDEEPRQALYHFNMFFISSPKTWLSFCRMREAKDFMLSTFYQEAPIPRALKLGDPTSIFSFQNSQSTKLFLEKEMEMYMTSGASICYRYSLASTLHSIRFFNRQNYLLRLNGKCVAVNFSCVWERNPDYEVLDDRFDATLWHNVAAELAAEHKIPQEKNIVWRDFQFQHLYNLAHRLMEMNCKSKTLYVGALYFKPELRDLGLSVALVKAISNHYSNSNTLLLCQSNFRGFDKFIEKDGRNPVVAEFARYDDEELVLDQAEGKAFSILSKLDGIKFYTDQ